MVEKFEANLIIVEGKAVGIDEGGRLILDSNGLNILIEEGDISLA